MQFHFQNEIRIELIAERAARRIVGQEYYNNKDSDVPTAVKLDF